MDDDGNFNMIDTTTSTQSSGLTRMSTANTTEFRVNDDNDNHDDDEDDDNANNQRCDETGDSDAELDRTLRANRMNNRCFTDQTTISRLQAMALSDDDDYGMYIDASISELYRTWFWGGRSICVGLMGS